MSTAQMVVCETIYVVGVIRRLIRWLVSVMPLLSWNACQGQCLGGRRC